jgi:hypothetical protein
VQLVQYEPESSSRQSSSVLEEVQLEVVHSASYRREVNAITVNNSQGRSMQTRQLTGARSTEENKGSACEELTQCAYSKTESVIIN